MNTILPCLVALFASGNPTGAHRCAQALLYTIQGLMPSPYQILSLKAIFAMFWEPQRVALPEQCVICLVKRTLRRPQRDFIRKSAAALSRFLNEYGWPTRAVIRATRKQILKELLKYSPKGKRPHLQVQRFES